MNVSENTRSGNQASFRRLMTGMASLLLAGGAAMLHWPQDVALSPGEAGATSSMPPPREVTAFRYLPESPELRETLTQMARATEEDRQHLLDTFLETVAPRDFQGTLTLLLRRLESTDGADADAARAMAMALIREWAAANPEAASQWAVRLAEDSSLRNEALGIVGAVWGNESLKDAAAWARSVPDQQGRETALAAVAAEAARTDPALAAHLSGGLSSPAGREMACHAAMEWASHDAASAVDWAREQPEGEGREKLLAAVAAAWSESDPTAAASLAAREISSEKIRDDAVMGVVQRWAQSDPGATSAWVKDFPEGELKATAEAALASLAGSAGEH